MRATKILFRSCLVLLIVFNFSLTSVNAEDPPNQRGLERSMHQFQGLIDAWLEQLAELPQKIVGDKIDQGVAEAKDMNTRISDKLENSKEWFKEHFGGLHGMIVKFNDWIKNHSGWLVDLVASFRQILMNFFAGLYELFQRVMGIFWRSTEL